VTRTLGGWILGTHAAACERGKVVKNSLVILEKQVAGLNQETLERFVLRARRAVGLRGMVNVLVTSSTAVRSLNRQFRRQNAETDVLSFPSMASPSKSRKQANLAGDVAISADIARQNSDQLGHAAGEEIKILALHGILHLAGFDHERDNGEMARKELKLRRALGLPAALIERAQSQRGQRSTLPRRATRATGARRMA
jgi:probable rRNA maturation factor